MIDYVVISLDELLHNEDYSSEKIEEAFKKFSCQREPDLENFLQNKAIFYSNKNFGKTFLFIDEKKLLEDSMLVIAGYVTLGSRPMDISAMSLKQKRKALGEYPGRDKLDFIPAFLIGQLGRDDNYSSEDLPGEQLLNECYCLFAKASVYTGGSIVILECRSHMYDKFYSKQGYKKLYNTLNDDNLYELYIKVDFKDYLKLD